MEVKKEDNIFIVRERKKERRWIDAQWMDRHLEKTKRKKKR